MISVSTGVSINIGAINLSFCFRGGVFVMIRNCVLMAGVSCVGEVLPIDFVSDRV